MGFHYYDDHIDHYEDPLEVECDMYEDFPVFKVLMTNTDMKIGSVILRSSFPILIDK